MKQKTIIDFKTSANANHWIIIDDVVMGGKSSGHFKINEDGYGKFYGEISLDNNGGFSSVRYRGENIDVEDFTKVTLHLKGDGKRYQFRIKADGNDKHSYVTHFSTTGDWETITINLKALQPKFRGKHLERSNFSETTIAELGFLFGNKTAEPFTLLIDSITLQ